MATWEVWNGTYTTSSTSSGTNDTATVWWRWCDNSTSATSTDITWTSWTTTSNYLPARELTAEERAAELQRLRAAQVQAEAWAAEARAAVEKAEALLQAHLDDDQKATLARESAFLVSVKSGRKYKIKRGQRGNVKELDERGQEVRSFCIHPDDVPDQDAMLAQKLLLETDEAAFRRIANVTELRRVS